MVVVGAGAAGLATAIFVRRSQPALTVVVLEGARKPGAKILVSGGSRCNVTNVRVSDADFWGGRRAIIRRVLAALPVPETVRFFAEIGVALHEEADGKLFPDSNRARDVLDGLLNEAARLGAIVQSEARVVGVDRTPEGFRISTSKGDMVARALVLATGGRSLPKSGSDGLGYELAKKLGHAIVPTTPSLVPLVLDSSRAGQHPSLAPGPSSLRSLDSGGLRRTRRSLGEGVAAGAPDLPDVSRLSGISHDAELTVWMDGAIATRLRGALLWTHFGVSGPVALNASRHWARADLEGKRAAVTLSCCPDETFDAVDQRLTRLTSERPRARIQTGLAAFLPSALGTALLDAVSVAPDTLLGHLRRDDRRRLGHALTSWPLAVSGTRGYTVAEATAGGVALDEIDPATMESRVCPGLFLVGEILDVDGRIGGFNFQWAWSSARAAARGLSRPQPLIPSP